ncbi:uncharacterized protein FA14DRAFT_186822 [Meira miltonrushii]|uniref:ARM repeat-containing protein n=1 Tax=Meira miltonrushii TaxID=1280837 RepID=A0A316VKN9_9BASI|nr:uncharacterized protein FA14DRAFT_186822 [Meira miltonrushii]PWN36621.1 hypothetical protein FA14DRAFT_186822 [Meira miltonrushii]
MEGITLLESKTSRVHFAFVKRLEGAKTSKQADQIIQQTIQEVRSTLQSKEPTTLSESTIASQLLVLLHCFQVYPFDDLTTATSFNLSFALVPTLHLLATAQYARRLQIAYSTLALLIGPFASPNEELQTSSLLVLNTIRQHLGSHTHSSTKRNQSEGESSLQRARQYFALRSIVKGTPSGSDCVPALYGPVSNLITHEDDRIKALAIEALFVLNGYREEEEDQGITRATYERVRDVVTGSVKRNGKQKARSSEKIGSKKDIEGLKRSLVKVSRIALTQGVISMDEFVSTLVSLDDNQSSTGMKTYIAKNLSQQLSKEGSQVTAAACGTVIDWASTGCKDVLGDNPLFLELTRLLGIVRSSSAEDDWKGTIADVWQVLIGHLQSRNANRRILALSVLDALLPFGWQLGDSDVQLSEENMQSLMSLLSDADATIRIRCLRLFCKIDTGIVSAHLDALKKAAEEGSKSQEELSSLSIRICETLKCLCDAKQGDSISTIYSPTMASLLRVQSRSGFLDDRLIERVTQDFQEAYTADAAKGIAAILKEASEAKMELSPTYSLLISTLVCTALEQNVDDAFRSLHREMLRDLTEILPLVGDKNAALQEAMMIACIKLASLSGIDEAQEAMLTLSHIAESSKSTIIKTRVGQLSTCVSSGKLEDLAERMKIASLLSTLDRIEEFFSQSGQSKNDDRAPHESKQRMAPKPLHYDAYASPPESEGATTLSHSQTSVRKANQPYTALPTPSQMRKQVLADQGKYAMMEQTIHQSIAQLTLGEDVDEERHVPSTATEDDAKGDVVQNENTTTAPREGLLF